MGALLFKQFGDAALDAGYIVRQYHVGPEILDKFDCLSQQVEVRLPASDSIRFAQFVPDFVLFAVRVFGRAREHIL